MAHQKLKALKVEPVLVTLGDQAGHVGAHLGLVEHEQKLALAHHIALAHKEALDSSIRLSGQLHLFDRLQGADRVDVVAETAQGHRLGRHLHLELLWSWRTASATRERQQGGRQRNTRSN